MTRSYSEGQKQQTLLIDVRTSILLLIHAGGVPQRERDDLIARAPLGVRRPIGPDEGLQLPADRRGRVGSVLQVEQVEVGLGAVRLGGGLARPRRCGGDELVQGLTVVILQIQRQGLCRRGRGAAQRLLTTCRTRKTDQRGATQRCNLRPTCRSRAEELPPRRREQLAQPCQRLASSIRGTNMINVSMEHEVSF